MKILLKIMCVCFMVICFYQGKAQTPANDPAWHEQANLSDEFNKFYLDTVLTSTKLGWHADNATWNSGAEWDVKSKLSFQDTISHSSSDTVLEITVDTSAAWFTGMDITDNFIPPDSVKFGWLGGSINTLNNSNNYPIYKYGYFEISAKYPTSYWAYWPAFWLYSSTNEDPTCDSSYYNELDIAEVSGGESYAGNEVGTNVHMLVDTCWNSANAVVTNNYQQVYTSYQLSSGFHKYAVEWEPNFITWYIDDVAVRTYRDNSGLTIPQHYMNVILNFAVDPYSSFLPSDWTLGHTGQKPEKYPAHFYVDYIRYYRLTCNCTGGNIHICTPSTDYSARAVEQSITVAGSGCTSTTFNTSDEYTLRAVNSITLSANTTINANSSGFFAIETLTCPN